VNANQHFLSFSPSVLALDVVVEGWKAGVIRTAEVIDVATQRMALGLPQDADEERLALMLSDQLFEAEEILRSHTTTNPEAEKAGRRIVIYARLMAVLDDWDHVDMPELEAEMVLEDAREPNAYADARLYDPRPGARRSARAHRLRLVDAAKAERDSLEKASFF